MKNGLMMYLSKLMLNMIFVEVPKLGSKGEQDVILIRVKVNVPHME